MAVPSSGPLSLLGIQREIFNNNYSASNSHSDISLTDLSEGADEDINTANAASDRPDGNTPHSMSEFYNYDHDLVTETVLHSSSFQPQKATHQFPYQPLYHFSGFRTSKGNYPGNTLFGSINSEGSFSLGGKTGVAIGQFYNYNIDNSSTTGTRVEILFSATSSTNFANSGWTKLEVYASSDGSGSVLLTLNRADAQFTASGANGTHGRKAKYAWPSSGHNGSRAFSTFFGTSTTASSNTTHFIKIIE